MLEFLLGLAIGSRANNAKGSSWKVRMGYILGIGAVVVVSYLLVHSLLPVASSEVSDASCTLSPDRLAYVYCEAWKMLWHLALFAIVCMAVLAALTGLLLQLVRRK